MIKHLLTLFLKALFFFSFLSLKAQHTHFQTGDIFLGQGSGIIQWRDSNGVLIRNIVTGDGGGNGNGTGLRIHPITGQLWVTNSNLPPGSTKGIRIINTDGTPGPSLNISMHQKTPTSVTFDKLGNAYIGGLWNDTGDEIVKINPSGTAILDHYRVSSDNYVWGAEWVEMDCNDSIIYYTNLRERVKRYNVATRQQLADFADLTGSVSWLFAMRLLRDNTMLVVTADHSVKRLNASGTVIQTYGPTNTNSYFGLAVTPDEKYFWVGGLASYGPMHKYNIAGGNLADSFLAGPALPGINIHGVAIYGDGVKNCLSTNPTYNNPFTKTALYPNPGHENFTLQTDLIGKITVRVFNKLGQAAFLKEYDLAGPVSKIPLRLFGLDPGIYYVQVTGEKEVRLQKIVVH
jgi:hypothetical protein